MISRLRDAIGGAASREAADCAVRRGMAELLAALDNEIDDDAALARVYAELGKNAPAAPARCSPAASREASPATSPRRLVLRSAAAFAAALTAGAVVVEAILVPEVLHNPADGPAVTSTLVVQRVGSALAAADHAEIAQMTVTTRDVAASGASTEATALEWSYGEQWRSVVYSPPGHLLDDEGASSTLYLLVSYLTRTWAREPVTGHPSARPSASQGCGSIVAALASLFQPKLPAGRYSAQPLLSVVGKLRAALTCGALVVATRQSGDKVESIELTLRPNSMIAVAISISPRTYLPVRITIRPARELPGLQQTAGITWLRPTGQNLARMTVPIPTGFRQVSLADAAPPIAKHAAVAAP